MIPLDTPLYGTVTLWDLILFLVVVVLSLVAAKIFGIYLKRSLSDRMDRGELDKLIKVIQIFIIGFGIWIALPGFDFDIGQFLVIGGTVGLIIAFASQKIVSNLGSGLFLQIERPIKTGDTVRIGSISGTVYQIRVLSTILKTGDGIYVRVPNEQVFTSDITNFVASPARRVEYRFAIGEREDAEAVKQAVLRYVSGLPFALKNPDPSVMMTGLSDLGVEMLVRFWTPSAVWDSYQAELPGTIRQILDRMGVGITFPHRVIRDEDIDKPEARHGRTDREGY